MKISKNKAVTLSYVISDEDGAVIESSGENDPLRFIQYQGDVPAGLERAVDGASPGDTLNFTLQPEDAYGRYRKDLIYTAPARVFKGFGSPRKGLRFRAEVNGEEKICRVIGCRDDVVTYDTNHPLAGKTLEFNVTIRDVAEA